VPPETDDGGDGGSGFVNPPLDCDEESVCGGQLIDVSLDIPNLYFVLDRSGSMLDRADASSDRTRYQVVRAAAGDLVEQLGPLIRVGAALFPLAPTEQAPCRDGGEVMAVGEVSSDEQSARFRQQTNVVPRGGTPIAATLNGLIPVLEGLRGRTAVVLLTDGGPNCNETTSCGADTCIPNIEGFCDPGLNCCDPEDVPDATFANCLDDSATLSAVQTLRRQTGADVYVIGIPGSEAYSDLLDQMATAGGTALEGQLQRYYRVDDFEALGGVFSGIAGEQIDCEVPLVTPPENPALTNVYLDCDVVPQDIVNGWRFVGADNASVLLLGDACARLKSGAVDQVRVVFGCPTEQPN
ncbi:MAG: vWA domain-containing protein, partial [Myxococcota bacterium]